MLQEYPNALPAEGSDLGCCFPDIVIILSVIGDASNSSSSGFSNSGRLSMGSCDGNCEGSTPKGKEHALGTCSKTSHRSNHGQKSGISHSPVPSALP